MKKVIQCFLFVLLLNCIFIPFHSVLAASSKPYITISQKNVSIFVGNKKKLTITSNTKISALTWSSSNSSIVSIDKQGVILGRRMGKVTITASYTKLKLKATTIVTVKENVVYVSKIIPSDKDINLREGESVHITATVQPSNATNKSVTWSSSNSLIASVEQDGTITANNAGTANITITSNDKKVKSVIPVKVEPLNTPNEKEIIKQVSDSVVLIEAYDQNGNEIATGSGFILSSDGRIATNFHVVTDDQTPIASVKVKLVNGNEYSTNKVIGYDKNNDLAIIKIDNVNGLKPVVLGNSDNIQVGDKIITIGSPLGLENTVSEGIISNKERVFDGIKYIQISAPISHGSSGGALLNENGDVIGVTSAGMDDGQDLNFAIPINILKSVRIGDPVTLLSLQVSTPSTDPKGGNPLPGKQDIIEKEPDNTLAQSNIIKNMNFSIIGSINGQYDLDYYKFTITTPQKILILAGMEDRYSYLTSELLMGILNENQKVVLTSKEYYSSDGNLYQEIDGTLQPGTYYLVLLGNEDSSYSWSLNPVYLSVGGFY